MTFRVSHPKGWVLFEYEGVGKVLMKAGSCFEIVSPARFKTRALPEARKSPARRSRG